MEAGGVGIYLRLEREARGVVKIAFADSVYMLREGSAGPGEYGGDLGPSSLEMGETGSSTTSIY